MFGLREKILLLLKIPKSNNNLKLKLDFDKYKNNKNENYLTKIYINNKMIKTINIQKENDIEINLKKENINKEMILKFEFENVISPWEIFESPDARKLGILLKSLSLKEIIKNISIIIPVYNDSKKIVSKIKILLKKLKEIKLNYEVIIINDGSEDNCKNLIYNFIKEKDLFL